VASWSPRCEFRRRDATAAYKHTHTHTTCICSGQCRGFLIIPFFVCPLLCHIFIPEVASHTYILTLVDRTFHSFWPVHTTAILTCSFSPNLRFFLCCCLHTIHLSLYPIVTLWTSSQMSVCISVGEVRCVPETQDSRASEVVMSSLYLGGKKNGLVRPR